MGHLIDALVAIETWLLGSGEGAERWVVLLVTGWFFVAGFWGGAIFMNNRANARSGNGLR